MPSTLIFLLARLISTFNNNIIRSYVSKYLKPEISNSISTALKILILIFKKPSVFGLKNLRSPCLPISMIISPSLFSYSRSASLNGILNHLLNC